MKLESLTSTYTLNNGLEIPVIGFGTWKMPNNQHTEDMVRLALETGYRHIDTATNYANEPRVGLGIRNSGLRREDVFLTSKLRNPEHGYANTKQAIDNSLGYLETDYIDLYLIHWPNPINFRDQWQESNSESWRAMEEAVQDGKIRSIGVSNFHQRHLEPLLQTAHIKPAVNQIYVNPSDMQKEIIDFNKAQGILTEAYSPLGHGEIFKIDQMKEIAKKYEKSVAQVAIRWSLQHGLLPLPKTETPSRLAENADVFDFEISDSDMKIIDTFQGKAGQARNPDEIDY